METLTAAMLTEVKPGQPITKKCDRCGENFTFKPKNRLEAKYINHCEPCWAIVDAAREDDYRARVAATQSEAQKAPFPSEFMEPWDVTRGVSGSFKDRILAWRPSDKNRSLFIFGPNGSCKTRLACLLAYEMQPDAGYARFLPFPAFAAEINAYGQRHFKETLDTAVRCPLLVFDDLTFSSSTKESDIRIAYMVLDGRYRSKKTTIITSNNGPHEIVSSDPDNWFLKAIQSRVGFSYAKRGIDTEAKNPYKT